MLAFIYHSIVKSKYVHFLFGMGKFDTFEVSRVKKPIRDVTLSIQFVVMVSSRLGQDSRRREHHLHRMFSEMRDAQFTYLNASKSGNSVCHQAEQDVVGK